MHIKLLMLMAALAALSAAPAGAAPLPEDSTAAVVYSYGDISDDDGSLTLSSFRAQIEELSRPPYNVRSLAAITEGRALPPGSVALTFDVPDYTFMQTIVPLLTEKRLPFTVFVSPGQIDAGGAVSWDDIRALAASDLVEIGLTSYMYGHNAGLPAEKLTADLNRARARFREELNLEPRFFAYPYGESSPAYRAVIEQQDFAAAFGQQSGVVSSAADRLALPRFTMTEDVADLDRLRMTAFALPFPVTDLVPASPLLDVNPPYPGFTAAPGIGENDLAKMTCFASGIGQLTLQRLGNNRVEIRFPRGFDDTRGRVNCTLPVPGADDPRDVRWRWLGLLYTLPGGMLDESAEDSRRDELTPAP